MKRSPASGQRTKMTSGEDDSTTSFNSTAKNIKLIEPRFPKAFGGTLSFQKTLSEQ